MEDEDAYRESDAWVTTNFDRTKYHFHYYFFADHYYAVMRRMSTNNAYPDDARVNP